MVRETVTNFVFWYDDHDPGITIVERDGTNYLRLNAYSCWNHQTEKNDGGGRMEFELPGKVPEKK